MMRAALLGLCLFAVGCTTNVSRFQMPGTDLADVRTLHVRIAPDERNAKDLQPALMANLKERGFELVMDGADAKYGEGHYIFDAAADWHWDITWYLIDFRVAIYEPQSETLIAQAQSQQSSLARKSVNVVVDRAMASLFDESEPVGEE